MIPFINLLINDTLLKKHIDCKYAKPIVLLRYLRSVDLL